MIPEQDYRPGLSARDLVSTLRSLLAAERTAMRLTCRYLADLADCMEAAAAAPFSPDGATIVLMGYADIYHAAQCLFGLGAHSTRERIRVGKALRSLPRIEEALVSGEVSYSRAREVTRVATPETESTWLDLARTLPMRNLERRVVEAAGTGPATRGQESPAGVAESEPDTTGKTSPEHTADPAHMRWTTPETVEVKLRLPAEAWALLQRAMEGARRASETSLSDAEALTAVARDAIEQQSTGTDSTDARNTVVLYECQSCGRAEVDTGAGPLEIGAGAAATLGCGARVRDLRTEGRIVRRGGPLPKAIERAVRLRDQSTCRVPGCHRRRYVDVHHIHPRSEGGVHSRANCVCLCTTHHARLHEGRLRIEGDADGDLTFFDGTGAPLTGPLASQRGRAVAPVAAQRGTDTVPSVSGSGMDAHGAASQRGRAVAPGASQRGTDTVPSVSGSGTDARGSASPRGTAVALGASQGGTDTVPSVSGSGMDAHGAASQRGRAVAPVAAQRGTDTVPSVSGSGMDAHGAASPRGTAVAPGASQHGTDTVPSVSGVGTDAHGSAFQRGTAIAGMASHRGRAAAMGVGEEAAALLALMGRRGGWTVDALVEASGLRVSAVHPALLGLELDGRVACDEFGSYAPCP